MSPRELGCLTALFSLVGGFALLALGIGAGFTALLHPDLWREMLPEGFGETWVGAAIAMGAIPAGIVILKLNPNEGADEDDLKREREQSPSALIGLFSSVAFSAVAMFFFTSTIWPMVFGDGETIDWDMVLASEPGWDLGGLMVYGVPIGTFAFCFAICLFVSPSADHRELLRTPKRALDRRAAAKYARAADAIAKEQQAGGVTLSDERGERGGVSEV